MRYAKSRYEQYQRDEMYRIYIADSYYLANQNKGWTIRYTDLVNGNIPKEDDRTGDEIASDVMNRLGITYGE